MSIGIFSAAADSPDRPALITAHRSLSYADLARDAARALTFLETRGVTASEPRPVAVVADSSVRTVALLHALFAIGSPALLVHPRLTAAERSTVVADAALIAAGDWPELAPARRLPAALPDDQRPLAILTTSGSTGAPKRVVLSRRALSSAARASAELLGWRDDDRWLACLPLAHVGGLSILIRCLLGRAAVVLGESSALLDGRVTLASLVPTQLTRLLDATSAAAPACLRAVLVGGAAASPALIQRARERGIVALATYGSSETSGQVATQRLGDPDLESVGPPLPGVEVRLFGERIGVRGPTLASDLPLEDGFFVSDDLGELDAQGRLRILGRASDRIVTGGENVDPLEIERVLAGCPGVAAACVFGIDDPVWGERVAVAIVPARGFDRETLAASAARALASFKRPRLYATVAEFQLRPSGKLDRTATAREALPRLEPL